MGETELVLDVGGVRDGDEDADGAFVDGAAPGQGDGEVAGEGSIGEGAEHSRAIVEEFPGDGVEFGGEGVDAQADATGGGLTAGFGPGGAEGWVGKEGVEQALAVGGQVVGGRPGKDVGREKAARELLLLAQSDLDRVAFILTLEDADF